MKALRRICAPAALGAALVLLAMSLYDLSVRADALLGPIRIIARMAAGEGMSAAKLWAYVSPELHTLWVPFHLLLCAAASLAALVRLCFGRKRPGVLPWVFLALGAAGLFLPASFLAAWTVSLRTGLLFFLAAATLILSLEKRKDRRLPSRQAPLPPKKAPALPRERSGRLFSPAGEEEHKPLWPHGRP